MQDWQLNNVAEIFVEVSAERLWTALTELADTQQYFMGSRVTVGGVGEPYCLKERGRLGGEWHRSRERTAI